MDPARFPVFLDRFRGCLRSFPPLLLCNVTFLAALVAFNAGLDLLRALPGRLFLPSIYAWVAGFAFSDDALEPVVLPKSIDESSETFPFPPRPGFFSCCPMVAASAVSGFLRLGVPTCGRVGVDSCEADASLIVIFDAVVRIDVDVSSSLGGFSHYEVGVPVFNQGDTEMVKPTLVREFSVDSNSNGLLDHFVPAELEVW